MYPVYTGYVVKMCCILFTPVTLSNVLYPFYTYVVKHILYPVYTG